MVTQKNKGAGMSGSSIGGRITAGQAASQTGVSLHEIVLMVKQKLIFGVCEGGLWYISPAVLPELRHLAASLQHRPPSRPEIYAGGIS